MAIEVLDLGDLGPSAESRFGGKAHGLSRLISAGARVPPGFAVAATCESPERWTEAQRHSLLDRGTALMGRAPVAVRSSAVGEDSAEQSFAGLFETALGVSNGDELVAAAGRCISSGAADRVLGYSGSADPIPVGLVIQSMVESRVAGVCFTVDPSGRDRAVVVEAAFGLGDRLVSGEVQPERWRAYRNGLGGWSCRCEEGFEVMSASTVERIAEGAVTLAEQLGEALDLEWAIDRTDDLWWLQARPITAALDPPAFDIRRSCEGVDDGPVTLWSNWNVRETMPDPMLPLTWTFWRDILMPVVIAQVTGVPPSSPLNRQLHGLDLVQGRIYFNMNAVVAAPMLGTLLRHALGVIDPEAEEVVRAMVDEGALQPRRIEGSRAALVVRLIAAGVRSLLRLTAALRPRRALANLFADSEAIARRPSVSGLSNGELLTEMRLWQAKECTRLLSGLQMEVVAIGVFKAAQSVFRHHTEALHLLATGIRGNPTTEISIAVDHLVTQARPVRSVFEGRDTLELTLESLQDSEAGRHWLAALDDFLKRYGHRGPMEFDLGAPRWRDDPSMIVELVRTGLESRQSGVDERLDDLAKRRSDALDHACAGAPRWRRPILRRTARLVELYMPLREAPKHCGLQVFDRARRAALELGRRLVERDVLADLDDVFYLEWRELTADPAGLGDLTDRISARKERHTRFLEEPAPDHLRSDGVPVGSATPASSDAKVLTGLGVSAGRATGAVKILHRPDPELVGEDQVLVMHFADPGWTPLFPRAAAVVVEVGGLMCHAAVVAREMGIPAVFGLRHATTDFLDGEVVEVDGESGTVTRL